MITTGGLDSLGVILPSPSRRNRYRNLGGELCFLSSYIAIIDVQRQGGRRARRNMAEMVTTTSSVRTT
nr:hypothetical protein CFP56_77893 [Quercus suber]